MGSDSKIQWTHHTFNPWWGCARVSPGCEHCYAEAFAKRTGKAAWGVKEPRRFFGDKHWAEPLKWNRAAEKAGERHRVFCASMADVFEDRDDLVDQRARLFCLIDETPHLDWLLLTKRPENIARLLPPTCYPCNDTGLIRVAGVDPEWCDECGGERQGQPRGLRHNVWLGATVEDQKRAEERIPELLKVPAAVRFLSCEPLLGRVDLLAAAGDPPDWAWDEANAVIEDHEPEEFAPENEVECDHVNFGNDLVDNPEHGEWMKRRRERAQIAVLRNAIHWVIVGGESGHGARPFALRWAYDIEDQCNAISAAFFMKQLGAQPVQIDRHGGGFVPVELVDRRKGGDIEEWPGSLDELATVRTKLLRGFATWRDAQLMHEAGFAEPERIQGPHCFFCKAMCEFSRNKATESEAA